MNAYQRKRRKTELRFFVEFFISKMAIR